MDALEKWKWTDSDFRHMGWHDATIHAIAVNYETRELLLDIDYILKWIPGPAPQHYFSFHVAPAILIFHAAHELELEASSNRRFQPIQIHGLERQRSRRRGDAGITYWFWRVVGNGGIALTVRASGYTQYFRQEPLLIQSQTLSLKQRGGIAFLANAPDKTSENDQPG